VRDCGINQCHQLLLSFNTLVSQHLLRLVNDAQHEGWRNFIFLHLDFLELELFESWQKILVSFIQELKILRIKLEIVAESKYFVFELSSRHQKNVPQRVRGFSHNLVLSNLEQSKNLLVQHS
jgi:hypothetical protein